MDIWKTLKVVINKKKKVTENELIKSDMAFKLVIKRKILKKKQTTRRD